MGRNRRVFIILLSVLNLLSSASWALGEAERPPQYVLLAFDGSSSIKAWQETRSFAKENGIKFTYFISGVYFLTKNNRMLYQPPAGLKRGRSDIGFGGNTADLQARTQEVLAAMDEGHAMGSHANGHFDGKNWTADDWRQEFDQFHHFVEDVFDIHHLVSDISAVWRQRIQDAIHGFRAPLLGIGKGLYQNLANSPHQYEYDTSKADRMNYWPKKNKDGLWNFPLAQIRIADTCKRTLSMDYNFYFSQSQGKDDLAHAEIYEDQMYRSYLAYFSSNYYGNRAPVNIGHHFSKFNGGAYWRAMMKFAKRVCGLPEVRCVSYPELQKFVANTDPNTYAHYEHARFPKYSDAVFAEGEVGSSCDMRIHLTKAEAQTIEATVVDPANRTVALPQGYSINAFLNDQQVDARGLFRHAGTLKFVIPAGSIATNRDSLISITVRDRTGVEIMRTTHSLMVDGGDLNLSEKDLDEELRLQADAPAAHIGE